MSSVKLEIDKDLLGYYEKTAKEHDVSIEDFMKYVLLSFATDHLQREVDGTVLINFKVSDELLDHMRRVAKAAGLDWGPFFQDVMILGTLLLEERSKK